MDCSTPGLPGHHQLPEFTQTHVHWVCDAIQPSHPLSSPSPPTLTIWTFVGTVMFLLFNTLCRCVIAFLPRGKVFLILWFQSPSTVISEPRKTKSVTASIFSPSVCYEVMGLDAMILMFWMLSFKPPFSLSSFTLIKRLTGMWMYLIIFKDG